MNAPFLLKPLAAAIRPRPYQAELIARIYAAWQAGAENVMAVLATGGGKCLGRGTPVLMYDGTIKPVEDVKVGDCLMGPDSRLRRVMMLARGREMLYRVTPTKGDPYVVNESHILSLKATATRSTPKYPSQRAGRVVNLTVREYLAKSATFKHTHKGWRTGVEFDEKTYPAALPPYLLGVWLGDGTSRNSDVTSVDPEIIDYLRAHSAACGLRLVEKKYAGRTAGYAMSGDNTGRGPSANPVRAALKRYNLIRNKHVPQDYLTGSRAQRLDLLAGLLDTDGSYTHKGYDFISKLECLADAVCYLARSLGMAAYKKASSKTCGNNGVKGDYFRVSISGHVDCIPCRIERKKAAPRLQKKDVTVTGIKVEAIGVGDYYGFEITGDRLFLLGDFTVTHNTVVLSGVFSQHIGAGMLVAHRQELVGQICESLNKAGLRFRILAPKKTIAIITKLLLKKHGVCHYDPTAELGVAGIDTLLNTPTSSLGKAHRAWLQRVTLGAIDEAHHVCWDNKWGRGMGLLPGCKRWLLPTASPCRGDGRGLGRKFDAKGERLPGYDGMADVMVEGPGTGDLIGMGYLTPFKVVCAKVSVNYEQVKIGPSGEYVAAQLVAAEEHSGLLGDIVETYQKYAPGKRGVCFVSSIKRAEELAERFTAAGVPALALDGTTDDEIRSDAKDRLERGELKMLVNVDLFGEGYDLPAIEVVILGTKTASLGRYLQWCGRVLRLLVDYTGYDDLSDAGRLERIAASMKPFGLIIDHANNIVTHGLPDKPHIWSLEGGGSSGASDSDAIPLRACTNPGLTLVKPGIGWGAWRKAGWTNEQLLEHGHATETGIPCAQPYEAFLRCCEFCGYMPEPKGRRDPAEVEGDLELLDEETMAAIRASYLEARQSIEHYRSSIASGEHGRMNHMMASANVNRHREKLEALAELDDAMARFGGKYRARGESDTQIQRRFYATFGVDVLTAASLKRADAEKLRGKIDSLLNGA